MRKFEVLWGNNQTESPKGFIAGFFNSAFNQLFNFHFGWYAANLNVLITEKGQPIEQSFGFLVIPWQLLSIVLIILLFIGTLGTAGLKRYNRWIIKKATQKI